MSTQTHHIEKVKDAPELRLDWNNTLPSCRACHAMLDELYEQDQPAYRIEIGRLRDVMDRMMSGNE